ncbi:MAG: enoyl-CoA hydratase/isomerase family protein [Halobacteriales archaeon]
MAEEPVRLDVEDGVATVTLNRPEKRNALSDEVSVALETTLREVAEGGARCLVITGAGGAFSAGGDVDRMRRRVEEDRPVDEAIRNVEQRTAGVVGQVYRFPVPTVAKIDGPAVGAGAGLALACDLQLASEDARMGFVFRHVGLSCDAGTSYLLPRLVGANKAKELLLTGEILDAERAAELGLLNHVYPADAFDDRVADLVATIADGPTVALRHAMRLVDAAAAKPFEDALADEAAAQGVALSTADHEEGVAAFLEDREPAFEGR